MIETTRLILHPLTAEQLQQYIKNDQSLERTLNLQDSSRTISLELKEALEETILPNVLDTTKNYLYSTLWTLISKKDNKMVGDLCMVGEPDAEGSIEIGYGTYDEFQGRGFMTEGVSGIILWAKKQPTITSVFAATEKANIASFTILQKNGFVKENETETLFHWRLKF